MYYFLWNINIVYMSIFNIYNTFLEFLEFLEFSEFSFVKIQQKIK